MLELAKKVSEIYKELFEKEVPIEYLNRNSPKSSSETIRFVVESQSLKRLGFELEETLSSGMKDILRFCKQINW